VYATLTPTGLRGPYSDSKVNPATIVGSANGRSITAFTALCPRNASRTSTHAMSVPKTALTAATTNDATSVSFRAATACGELIASQNELPAERATSAASGSRTTIDRYPVASPARSAGRA
jgi:hypothetical protein